jgi:hypothetical protein
MIMGSIKRKKEKKPKRGKVKVEKNNHKEIDPLAGVSSIGFDINYTSGFLLSFNNSDD